MGMEYSIGLNAQSTQLSIKRYLKSLFSLWSSKIIINHCFSALMVSVKRVDGTTASLTVRV